MAIKRAICLAGGGPTVGLSIGALERIHQEPDIRFDVWRLACIGAWLGIVWNAAEKGQELAATNTFFRHHFRPDDVYDRFPIASGFAPDFEAMTENTLNFKSSVTSKSEYLPSVSVGRTWFIASLA